MYQPTDKYRELDFDNELAPLDVQEDYDLANEMAGRDSFNNALQGSSMADLL